jgi:hypothetical protein
MVSQVYNYLYKPLWHQGWLPGPAARGDGLTEGCEGHEELMFQVSAVLICSWFDSPIPVEGPQYSLCAERDAQNDGATSPSVTGTPVQPSDLGSLPYY